ncbi:sulfotransferase [Streptomyces sp. NBC_01565]|uniref:sulfotransferase family protein n=1 Tax=unclassified Streptomyces TaxID=2593676 RepID=UPI00225B2E04|nr:sulfotransferase [Streptomyces sp. NBC_01565]MCX4545632.1 sulfotransferase [Streptomyces sp. NBC_01565]
MRSLTFVVGTGRSGSTALSRIVNAHPDVLSLNEFLASLGSRALPADPVDGAGFWRLLTDPNPVFDAMIRSGMPIPEFLYEPGPGRRYAAQTTGIPALSLMTLPHLTDDPDGLLDDLAREVTGWPCRPAAEHHAALFDVLGARSGRTAVVERSGYSAHWVPRLRTAFPGARFVHLFRDGADCALSMSRHPGYRMISLLREIRDLTGTANPGELTEEQARSLPPELAGLLADPFDPALVMERSLPLPGFGALWSEIVTEAAGHLDRVPEEQWTTLGYEQLLDDPRRELTRLAEFVGVKPLPQWLDAGCAHLDPGRRGASLRLPPGELAELREQCAPGVRALRASGARVDGAA